jgi:dTMP kinase
LAGALRESGYPVLVTHEPGATAVGRKIRQLLLDSDEPIDPRSEALLFAADRAHHVATMIRPALDRGEVVITDRFVDSSLAYQGAGRTLALDDIKRLSRWATGDLMPGLTVLLDLDPELGLSRVRERTGQLGPDRLERETLIFHQRVRAGFVSLAESEPDRYLVLDARKGVDELATTIRDRVLDVLHRGTAGAQLPATAGADGSGSR